MISDLGHLISESDHLVIILGSTNGAAFSAGADLGLTDVDRAEVSRALYRLYHTIRSKGGIVLAAAGGHAVGGGAQLMLASDIRVVNPDFSIRFVGQGHGLVVGAWGLPALIGRGRALELMLTMRTVGAEEAYGLGLVDFVADDPLQRALRFADVVTGLPGEVVAAVKRISLIADPSKALTEEERQNRGWDGSVSSSGPG
ncbi:MAG: enoyl-CoA hydratase/isomerase family protein [Actinobacteria bacterium]|nr:enoyl-CoA hydratase/isomerase family protein [Actinomycetota bacterium]